MIDANKGIVRFADLEELATPIANLTGETSSSIFSESFSASLSDSLRSTEKLGDMLKETTLEHEAMFADKSVATGLKKDFRQIAKIMKMREELGAERQAFVASLGAFDTHTSVKEGLSTKMITIDSAMEAFVTELKSQKLWEHVTIVTVSDFGRTLTSNGLGTDHGWGGNMVAMGGSVKGGRIHGKFPESLSVDSEQNIGRGRILPTTPWEGLWQPLVQWWGVGEEHMPDVLPNRENFPAQQLTSKEQMFVAGA